MAEYSSLEHPVLVRRVFRHWLSDVPQLRDAVVAVESKDVDDGSAAIGRVHPHVRMDDDEIVFLDDALDLEHFVGMLRGVVPHRGDERFRVALEEGVVMAEALPGVVAEGLGSVGGRGESEKIDGSFAVGGHARILAHDAEREALVARFFLICLGGAIGTGARYLVSVWAARTIGTGFPYGTLLVNMAGSFLLGLLMQLSLSTQMISADMRLIICTGILGGFTTYSTFNYETLALLREDAWGLALANTAATLIGCLVAGLLGIGLARAVAQ